MFPRVVFTYAPLLAAATNRRVEARLARCGTPPPVAMSLACAITPTTVCFTHRTHPQNSCRQPAGSLRDRRWAAPRHEPLSESPRRSPWLSPTAPVPPPRFACVVRGSIEADDGPPSRGAVALFAHEAPRPAWHSPTPSAPPHRLTFVQAPIERRCSPCRGMVALLAHEHGCRYGGAPTASAALVGSPYVRCRVRWRRPLPASAAVRSVRLLPAANACRPAHRLPPQQRLPFSAEVAAAPLAPLFLLSIPYDAIRLKPRIDKGHNS